MSAAALQSVINHAIGNQSFQSALLVDAKNAIDKEAALKVSSSDLTLPELSAVSSLTPSDFKSLSDLKAGLPGAVAEHTGGVIL